eukprot:COSAG01_NODE_1911_length_8925_cov_151.747111_4_plen_159_part_00
MMMAVSSERSRLETGDAGLLCAALQAARQRFGGLIFAGVAYKYQPQLHHKQDEDDLSNEPACQALLRHAAALTANYGDVLVTSGCATGTPCSSDKLRCLAGDWALAFSGGGERPALAAQADVVLAATALGVDGVAGFLQLDEAKMRAWVSRTREACGE